MNGSTAIQLGLGVFLLSSSGLLLLISLILHGIKLSPVRQLVLLSLFTGSCSLWVLLRNPVLAALFLENSAFAAVDLICQYAITFFSLTYAREFASGWRRTLFTACQIWTVLYVAVTSLYQATAAEPRNMMLFGAACNAVFIGVDAFAIGWETFREKNEGARRLLLSAIPILAGGLLEIVYFLRWGEGSTAVLFFVGFFAFVILQMFWFIRQLKERSVAYADRQQELVNARIEVMISQIQPHFLNNALQSIKLLCDTDPPKASEALEHFSFYLRGNLDALVNTRLVPFSKELTHIEDYLYLEKMRFGKKLNIVMDFSYQDFLLPALTVQPLIENAIRHGINKKRGGGTLKIRSERQADDVIITIQDDGVGFDPAQHKEDGRSHIGLSNTRERLGLLCGGSLLVQSEKGVGTTAKIILPQKEVVA